MRAGVEGLMFINRAPRPLMVRSRTDSMLQHGREITSDDRYSRLSRRIFQLISEENCFSKRMALQVAEVPTFCS